MSKWMEKEGIIFFYGRCTWFSWKCGTEKKFDKITARTKKKKGEEEEEEEEEAFEKLDILSRDK